MRTFLLLGALLGGAGMLAAQQSASPPARRWWVNLGLGAGSPSGPADVTRDIALELGVSVQRGANLFTLRTVSAFDDLFTLIFDVNDSVTAISDIGVLYGRASTRGTLQTALSAGVGMAIVTRGRASGDFHDARRFTVPLEGQLAWRFSRRLGVVLAGYASLNGEESMYGATVGLELGHLR